MQKTKVEKRKEIERMIVFEALLYYLKDNTFFFPTLMIQRKACLPIMVKLSQSQIQ